MNRFHKLKFALAIFLLSIAFSCNHHEMNSKKETAVRFYKQGLRFLQEREFILAEVSFNDAVHLKDDFAPLYEGLARVYLQRAQLPKAENFAKESLKLNKDWLPSRIVLARIYLAEGAFDLSRDELGLALKQMQNKKLPSLKSEIYALLSQNDLRQKRFLDAQLNSKKALALQPQNEQAQGILEEVKEITGRLRGRGTFIQELAAKTQISRADLARLLWTELSKSKLFSEDSAKSKQAKMTAPDVEAENPAFNTVQWCLSRRLLPLLPDSTFRPNDKVDRAEMTLFLQGILKVLFPDSLYSLPFTRGMHAYFDVDSSQPYFKALQTVSSLRLMESKDKYFRARHTVSGLEAIKSIDRLKEIMRDLSFH